MFDTFTAIMMLIVFLVPGYIWRSVEGKFAFLDHRLPWEKFALGLLTRSTFAYLPFTELLLRSWTYRWYDIHPFFFPIFAILLLVVWPTSLGIFIGVAKQYGWVESIFECAKKLQKKKGIVPHRATAWEAIFEGKFEATWVVVTRKNAEPIRGVLDGKAHVSVDPEIRDLYLSATVYFNPQTNKFEVVPNTKGIYICADEISSIEFIQGKILAKSD